MQFLYFETAFTFLRSCNMIKLPHSLPPHPNTPVSRVRRCSAKYPLAFLLCTLLASILPARAQVNSVGQTPYLGWSSFSQQTIESGFLTQAQMQAQSYAMAASGL